MSKELELIFKAGKIHKSVSVVYLEALNTMKLKGVAFDDIKNHLVNQLKKENIYTSSWNVEQSKDTFSPISTFYKGNISWAVSLTNFLRWVKKNWSFYGVKAVPKVIDVKARELKKVTNAWKVINNLFCDTDDTMVKEAMVRLDTVIKMMERR